MAARHSVDVAIHQAMLYLVVEPIDPTTLDAAAAVAGGLGGMDSPLRLVALAPSIRLMQGALNYVQSNNRQMSRWLGDITADLVASSKQSSELSSYVDGKRFFDRLSNARQNFAVADAVTDEITSGDRLEFERTLLGLVACWSAAFYQLDAHGHSYLFDWIMEVIQVSMRDSNLSIRDLQ